jgi:hypothetical protein
MQAESLGAAKRGLSDLLGTPNNAERTEIHAPAIVWSDQAVPLKSRVKRQLDNPESPLLRLGQVCGAPAAARGGEYTDQ